MALNRIGSDGTEQSASNVQRVADDGTPLDATEVQRVQDDYSLQTVWSPSTGGVDESEYLNLASEVPQRAWDVWEAKPDFRADPDYEMWDASDYDGRNGDLAERIENASQNGSLVDLQDGTYEMETSVDNIGTDIVGIVGDGARIYYTGTHLDFALFHIDGVSELVMEDVVFDISEQTADGNNSDNGVLRSGNISEAAWLEDVRLEGTRHRRQDLDGDGTYERVGDMYTFLVQVDEGATGWIHRCEFPDGDTDMSEEINDTSTHAIGPNADPGHQGLNVWKDCYCEGFYGNGYYMTTSEPSGENILWNCHAKNNGKGGIRVSWNDTVIGGTTEVVDPIDGNHVGTPFVSDYGDDVNVIGLEIIAAGDDWSAEAIQIRSNAQDISFDRTVLHVQSGDSRPIRLDTGPESNWSVQVELEDIYWYDESGAHTYMTHVSSPYDNGADATTSNAEECRIRSDGATEITVGTNGTLTVEGDTYSNTSLTASDLGLGDPLDENGNLPDFYFEYESTPEDS